MQEEYKEFFLLKKLNNLQEIPLECKFLSNYFWHCCMPFRAEYNLTGTSIVLNHHQAQLQTKKLHIVL